MQHHRKPLCLGTHGCTSVAGMTEVYLHVYDITKEADRSNAKTVLTSFNGAGRWTGLGGVFHGGIQVRSCPCVLLLGRQLLLR